jgi:hypothetical protein
LSTPRAEFRLECRVLRVILLLGLFLGVEMIEIAEELIEPVHRRQELVAVAESVLAELAGGVSERFQRLGDRDVLWLQAERCSRQTHLGHSGAQAGLAGDERRPTGRAALLGVVVGKRQSFAGDAVDIWGLVSHNTERVGADIRDADVVPHMTRIFGR